MSLFSQELFYSPTEIILLTCRYILLTFEFFCIYMLLNKSCGRGHPFIKYDRKNFCTP